MEHTELKQNSPPQRLCNEIQLFDLCGLNSCNHKAGRFCTNQDLVSRFEKISEEELNPPQRYIDEEFDEDEEAEYGGYDDEYDDEGHGENGWEDEE
ncbi:MAG: hypothetical protein WCP20_12655 [Desulfuromonadales bacterium]